MQTDVQGSGKSLLGPGGKRGDTSGEAGGKVAGELPWGWQGPITNWSEDQVASFLLSTFPGHEHVQEGPPPSRKKGPQIFPVLLALARQPPIRTQRPRALGISKHLGGSWRRIPWWGACVCRAPRVGGHHHEVGDEGQHRDGEHCDGQPSTGNEPSVVVGAVWRGRRHRAGSCCPLRG